MDTRRVASLVATEKTRIHPAFASSLWMSHLRIRHAAASATPSALPHLDRFTPILKHGDKLIGVEEADLVLLVRSDGIEERHVQLVLVDTGVPDVDMLCCHARCRRSLSFNPNLLES